MKANQTTREISLFGLFLKFDLLICAKTSRKIPPYSLLARLIRYVYIFSTDIAKQWNIHFCALWLARDILWYPLVWKTRWTHAWVPTFPAEFWPDNSMSFFFCRWLFTGLVYTKCLKGLAPSYLCDRFITRTEVHNPRHTRNKNKLEIPLCKSAAGQRSFLYRAVTLWNQLPDNIKDKESVRSFKSVFKSFLLEEFY